MELILDYDVRIVDCDFVINFCLVHLVKAQPFDFIKCNIIRKLAYKVKNISQINGA